MIQSNNKSASIAHTAGTILTQTEILQTAKLNKKQTKALQIIINLVGAVKEDAEFINNQLGEIVEKALKEQSQSETPYSIGESEKAF